MNKVVRFFLWLVVIIGIILLCGLFLPEKTVIERTVVMDSRPETVYAWVNDLTTYDKWMPWNRIDTAMTKKFGDKTSGVGAWYTWNSNNSDVGHGKFTITESVPAKKVITQLQFMDYDPSYGGWEITPSGEGSSVRWYMESNSGKNPVMRWMSQIMKPMLGSKFEEGLNSLKSAMKNEQATPTSSVK